MTRSVLADKAVVDIARQLQRDPAALLISWAIQRSTAVIPKSVHAERIESNFQGKSHMDAVCTANLSDVC